jgi:N-acyl-D-amino-acid deacylase
MPRYDLVIKNGRIVDGTGNSWLNLDIGISQGKIIKMGVISDAGERTVDAKGMIVSPGFIDLHNHSDQSILAYPDAESYIMQGVTSVVVGQCGMSMGPLNPKTSELFRSWISPFLVSGFDYQWDWKTLAEYYEKVEKQGTSLNMIPFVGHGTLRIAVKGFDSGSVSKNEMGEMKKLLHQSMEAGAFGLSTGLILPPSSYANSKELIELTSVLKSYGGIYSTHLRSESYRLIEALEEAIEIAEKNGIPLQVAHHKAVGKSNWGKVNETLKLIEKARERGVEVNIDVYPYTAANQMISLLLPPWTLEGGAERMLERLKNKNDRIRIKKEIDEATMEGEVWLKAAGWAGVIVTGCPPERKYEGFSLEEILRSKNQFDDPYEGLFDWILEIKANATIVVFAMDETDVQTVIRSPLSSIITDIYAIAPSAPGKIHPRAYGTYPRFLGRYVREQKLLPLEEAIRKITSLPAGKLRINDRGLLREGFWADIVIFDPEKIIDKATYVDPHQYPEGINYVIVNGQTVVDNGSLTGTRPGEVLRKNI